MREIKLRAWDKSRGHMLTKIEVLHFGHTPTGSNVEQVFGYNPSKEVLSQSRWCALNSLVPMQYTGLKDKNGKEIYESDILSSPVLFQPDRVVGEVRWLNEKDNEELCSFGYYVVKGKNPTVTQAINPINASRLEVIGNIYENPELLNG